MKAMIQAVILSGAVIVSSFANQVTPSSQISAEQAMAAARLRTQDQMFGLLMAAYFEVQQEQIDRDFERRLKIAADQAQDNLGLVVYSPLKAENKLPNAYRMLVLKERELRLARMAKNINHLMDLYQISRVTELKEIGMNVPSAVDLETAIKEVKKLLATRAERPHDPRLWAEHDKTAIQALVPQSVQDKSKVEAMLQQLLEAERKATPVRPTPLPPGLIGTTLFGLPMLKTPATSRP